MATREEKFRELQESIREHQRKMETDPEYRKEYEKTSAEMDKAFGWTYKFKHDD